MLASIVFLFFFVWPAFGLSCYSRFWRGKFPGSVFLLLLCLVGCILYVGGVSLVGWKYQRDLDSYDLDGDGEFSITELTPGAEAAMQKFVNDTGRSLAPIVALPATLVWVGLNLILVSFFHWLSRKLRRHVPAPI